jgi:hypothetical protein
VVLRLLVDRRDGLGHTRTDLLNRTAAVDTWAAGGC